MPEVSFTVQLPDETEMHCYSPSTVVRDFFSEGETLIVSEFVARSRKAYAIASERVRAKYGFSCSSAAAQIADIELAMRAFSGDAQVRITNI